MIWTYAQKAKLYELVSRGLSAAEIALQLGIGKSQIFPMCYALNLNSDKPRIVVPTKATVVKVIIDHDVTSGGFSRREIPISLPRLKALENAEGYYT